MTSIYDVHPRKLINKLAELLDKDANLTPPVWAAFVKTGVHAEKPPTQKNWWHIRSAAVLRIVYKNGPVGVSKLRSKYGGRKNRGVKPSRFKKSSGNILRKVLQQLEKAGYVTYKKNGVHKGRIIAPKGAKLLAEAAKSVE